MADLVLELAMVLVIVVVLRAIPRMRAADQETLAALHRRQAAHHQQTVRPIDAHQLPDEQRHAKQAPERHAA